MATIPDKFEIFLQKGIERGFAPPTPTARYIIARTTSADVFTISTQFRPLGTPHLSPPKTKGYNVEDHAKSIARLFAILLDLPPQYPGVDDLYGRNISILYATGAEATVNFLESGPGNAAACSIVPPTVEQKALFDEAVEIIEDWACEVSA